MANHWKASKDRWALENGGILRTNVFPLSCGTEVRLPMLFATRNKARAWIHEHRIGETTWRPVRVELGYRRTDSDV